ncbi:unnamed protein product [Symbiodinium pilosum]|uniref:Uncharacterized protein n=1 Tax=Symbiodinium pilosum TaxID=2952 RepID=A0A812MK77_SYMPI|nr:unnamed protein product [Symbiodinium pilosum]
MADPAVESVPDSHHHLAIAPSVASSDAKDCRPGHPAQIHYEQLLSIQQDQHSLAMERKEAEIAHLKVRLATLEGHIGPQDAVKAAVQTKDEECALMMAAKHKELELLATLLQMREQQIEELRSQCEESQLQLTQLRLWSGSGSCRASPGSSTPLPGHLGHPSGRLDADSQMRREVQRLRLRMEDLEASVTEQQDRCAILADELHIKSERVEVLESQIQSLKWQDGSAFHQGHPEDTSLGGDITGPNPPRRTAEPWAVHDRPARAALQVERSQESFVRQPGSPSGQEPCGHSLSPYPSEEDSYSSAIQHRDGETEHFGVASTGRQSQELLREMRRLRQQMTELEKLAAGRDPGFAEMSPSLTSQPEGVERLGAASSLSMSSGSRQSGFNVNGQGMKAPNMTEPGAALTQGVFRPRALSEAFGNGPSIPPAEDGLLSAWEYRPHEGDPVDAAVARLVNRGRYRAWRALLCRLEYGVYLCGTKRVHVRVDEEQQLLEASKDGGRTWADLSQILT